MAAPIAMNTESFLFSIVDEVQRKQRDSGFSGLTPREQVFYLVWALEAEVNNGGFDQFLLNSAGDYTSESVDALRQIGAIRMASLVQQAIEVFLPAAPSRSWSERQTQVLALTESQAACLQRLDNEFYTYPEDLSQLLASFMQEHDANAA